MKFSKSKNILGIELTPSVLKVVEIDPSLFPPLILNFASSDISLEDSQGAAGKLGKVIEENQFETRKAILSLSGPSIDHNLLLLPPMSKGELKNILRREVRRVSGQPLENIIHDYCPMGEGEEKGIKKDQILLVTAPKPAVNNHLDIMSKAGLTPLVITSISMAFLNLYKMREDWDKDRIQAFVEVNRDNKGNLNIVMAIATAETLHFSREFNLAMQPADSSTPVSGLPGKSDPTIDKMILEINRSFLYFKQQHRGRQVERLVLSGGGPDLSQLANLLREGLRVETEVFNPLSFIDFSHIWDRKEEFQESAPAFAVPIALALERSRKARVNLIPIEIREKKQALIGKVVLALATLILLASSVTATRDLSRAVNIYQQISQDYQTGMSRLNPYMEDIAKTSNAVELHQARLSFLQSLKAKNPEWLELFKDLSLLVPKEMVFKSFRLTQNETDLEGNLQGEVIAPDQVRVQEVFNQFYSDIRKSPFFKDIELKPIEIGLLDEQEATRTRRGEQQEAALEANSSMSKLAFEINLYLD